LATRLHSPVVGLASQNRAQGAYGKGNGAAALDSLKESGDLEYSADVVLFLTHDKEQLMTPPARAIKLTVAKNRNGDTGDINLVFRPDISSFGEEDWKH
jgi:replicative DNA helicase